MIIRLSKLFLKFYFKSPTLLILEKRTTKEGIVATKHEKLNDVGFRIVLIPFFGIAVPLLTGMVSSSSFAHWQIKLSFLYTIAIAFIVWHGNRFLLFSLRSYFDWLNKPIRKIIVLLLSISFFTIPVSSLMITGWYHLFASGQVEWEKVFVATMAIMICVIFITHVYETVFLVKQAENDKLKSEQLERSKVEAELQAFKNQIDPHFIFNSLNTLSHLIEKDAIKAKLFNDNLADVYRYILLSKSRDLVLLREEIDFLNGYFSLLKIRFENAVQLHCIINNVVQDSYLIPPISLQVLMENAIKHNDFSDFNPMVMTITIEDEVLTIMNNVKKKVPNKVSSGTGLINLNERYRLVTGLGILTEEKGNMFEVRMPVLNIT